MKRSKPLKRTKPLQPSKDTDKPARTQRAYTALPKRSFSEKYPANHPGPKYGPLFRALRDRARGGECWLCDAGYQGPGHKIGDCALGVTGGPTAHHCGRLDEHGMLPGGGQAHDLFHGLGGETTIAHFRDWLDRQPKGLDAVGLAYVAEMEE